MLYVDGTEADVTCTLQDAEYRVEGAHVAATLQEAWNGYVAAGPRVHNAKAIQYQATTPPPANPSACSAATDEQNNHGARLRTAPENEGPPQMKKRRSRGGGGRGIPAQAGTTSRADSSFARTCISWSYSTSLEVLCAGSLCSTATTGWVA